jgi:hypothetical protein
LVTTLVLATTAAQAVTPCDRLVAYARGLPPSVWATGDKALGPALVFDGDQSDDPKTGARTALEHRLVALPEAHESLGVDDESAIQVDRLAGTDVYALTTVQGTAHCYTSVFVRARPGREPLIVTGPKSLGGDGTDICWTTVEGLGRAFDTPVHVVHDLVLPTTITAGFTITPWRGADWGAACRAELTFRAAYALEDRFCGDKAVCETGAKVAREVAAAYNHLRETSDKADTFAFGPPPPPEFAARLAAVKLAEAAGDFPTFGAAAGSAPGYGGSGHVLFPLQLGDHWYAAAVGRGGVGWREDDTTLLAVFDLDGQTLTPLAGFVVKRSLAALDSARTTPVGGD